MLMGVAVYYLSMRSHTTSTNSNRLAAQFSGVQVLAVAVAFAAAVVAGVLVLMYTGTAVAFLVSLVAVRAGANAVSKFQTGPRTVEMSRLRQA